MNAPREQVFIRKHPIVSVWILVTVLPLLVIGSLFVIRQMPACSEWRSAVRLLAESNLSGRYMGSGNSAAVDAAYRSEGSGYAEIMASLMEAAEHELEGSRPWGCL